MSYSSLSSPSPGPGTVVSCRKIFWSQIYLIQDSRHLTDFSSLSLQLSPCDVIMVRWDTDDGLHYHRGHCYCNFVCQPLSRSAPLTCGGGQCQWSDSNDGPDRKLIAAGESLGNKSCDCFKKITLTKKIIPGDGGGWVYSEVIHEQLDYSALLTRA